MTAATVLRRTHVSRLPRILGLVVTGLIGARRGQPDATDLLDEALTIAWPSGELQRIGPAAAARAEAAWLQGDRAGVDRATAAALALAARRGAPWVAGELIAWRQRAAFLSEPLPELPEPYAAELSGDWAGAAAFWRRVGCPYETALSRAGADDEAPCEAPWNSCMNSMPRARRRSWRGDCESGARAGCRAGRGERRCAIPAGSPPAS